MASNVSETTALLPQSGLSEEEQAIQTAAHRTEYETIAEAVIKKDPDLETTWRFELKKLLKYSAPLTVTSLLQYSFSLVTVYVAGQLGTNELAAASLASMTSNITGLCVYEGLATSLDTLTSQAFGAGKKHLVGLHVQRMVFFLMLVTIPIGAVWICSPWILAWLVPEKELARLAGSFLRIYLVGAPGYAIMEAGKRFVQAQGNFTACLAVLLVVAPINIFLNWLFVWKLQLGFSGAALAVAISNILQPVLLVLYILYIDPATLQCWPGFSRAAFRNWLPMIRLSIPGVAMVFCEWLAFDILTFSASYLSAEHLAAQSVLMAICVTMYHIPFPISIAASTRFGNLIGYGALPAAKTAFKLYYTVFAIIGVCDIIILTTLRNVLPALFTADPTVRAIIASVVPVVAAAQFFDATTALSNALLRGLGRQHIGGWMNLCVYYLFAIPLSLFLTFGPARMELEGLWIGPCCGLGVCTIGIGVYMTLTNWEGAVEDARRREE